MPALTAIEVGAAAFTTTVAVCVMATAPIVADTVFDSAKVELSIPVARPFTSVGPVGGFNVLKVPLAASATLAPWIGLPNRSRAFTVIALWLVPEDATIGELAVTVDRVAETPSAVMVTAVEVSLVSVPLDATSVYPAAALSIDKSENVATPAAAARVSVPDNVPPPGFAARAITTLPVNVGTTLPLASCAVTVTAGLMLVPAVAFEGCCANLTCVAPPAVMLNAAEVPGVRPVPLVTSV